MSRTDKTRPYYVRLFDSEDLTKVPHHRHETGECDLPETFDDTVQNPNSNCFYDFFYTGTSLCSCDWCTGKPWLRASSKALRHKVHQILTTTPLDDGFEQVELSMWRTS